MAPKLLPPKQLQNLRFFITRSLHTSSSSSPSPSSSSISTAAAVSPLNLAEKPEPAFQKPLTAIKDHAKPSSILDFHDHQKLFSNLPSTKLLHASLNIYLASISPMVDFGMWVMNSRLMETDNILRAAMIKIVRHTFFEHFCAGEDVVEAGRCIKKVNESGLRGMLVFAVEYTGDNDACDQNLKGFLDTVQSAMSLPPSSVSSVVVKITAICPSSLLERVSDLLRWQQRYPSFNLPWKQNSFPLFSDSSPLYHTLKKPEPLTPQEEQDLQLGQERLWKLCEKSVQANIPLTVDAEKTAIQPAIDYLTYSAAIKYNKDDNPIVYGTIQAYLKDAKERLLLATKAADKMRVPMGFKVVRGAYMSSESKLASALGYDSPIHNSIQETHACYNDCASFMLEKIANSSDAVILATHNVESGRLAATKALDLGIGKGTPKLEFAQLYGMSDALSFGLSKAGFLVSKYMPYGPVEKVIPYLLRRAEENRGLLSTSSIDKELMRKELKRRLKAAIF
ncbi:proline dehydrogenase 2 [Populus alba x Populus x berolinensis]|uniref:Uncharacterized protein n=3 Tax=Populus TaxID=3689 RepID=A0ACC4CFV8_POPAL|nr:proline dehydrogenase 2, mitochondrial-like [Populus alba]KAJ6936338.1 proline dehydrogenase 2 [Populus alba x Populus x berolinensis]KAJ7000675.1 proline dehydrogenase 2 [Populus alba x Populus x berolinensis]TKS07546.1 proline dehydrogenase 2, mitochondrial-like [Populus alba]